MLRTTYQHLNTVQKGAFGEAFSKMAFTLEGFEVYNAEYDDRGVDFVCRSRGGRFFSVQVKTTEVTAKSFSNPFIYESKFTRSDDFLFCAVQLIEGSLPSLFLARGSDWNAGHACLAFNANGGSAGPYYEIRFSRKYAEDLKLFAFSTYIEKLRQGI